MPHHQLIEVWVIGTKEKEVLLVGLGLSCSMVSNGTIVLQGGDLVRFGLPFATPDATPDKQWATA